MPREQQKKYFRHHRGLLADSMSTMVEVNGLDDIKRIVEEDSFLKGLYKNIRIGDGFIDERCVPYGWGNMVYYVLADFDNCTGQCIGMTNFKED